MLFAFLRKKQTMKTQVAPFCKTAVPLLLTIATACDTTTIIPFSSPPEEPHGELYAAAIEFPAGYDWRSNPDEAPEKAELVFYHDSTVVFRKKIGKTELFAADADMHRICGRHLYSDFSTDFETFLFKDGEEMLRWDGREMVEDILIKGDDIHMLTVDRAGESWSYRVNGEEVAGGTKGRFLSGLYEDRGKVCFSVAKPLIATSTASPDRHYIVSGGKDSLLVFPADIRKVLAAHTTDGRLDYIATIANYDRMIWQQGTTTYILEDEKTGPYPYGKLMTTGSGQIAFASLEKKDCLWDEDGRKFFTSIGKRIISICHKGKSLCYAVSGSGGMTDTEIFRDNESFTLPDGYAMTSPGNLACDAYGFAVGVSDTEDNFRPIIIRGKKTMKYGFNGYFICLALP